MQRGPFDSPVDGDGANQSPPRLDDSAFSLLYSTRQSQRIVAPTYLLNLIFVFLLTAKLNEPTKTLPWPIVFSTLFTSNLLSFYVKVQEFNTVVVAGESRWRILRQLSGIVDLIGSFLAKISLCYYLQSQDSSFGAPHFDRLHNASVMWDGSLTAYLWPLWIGNTFATALRCVLSPSRSLPESAHLRYQVTALLTAVLYFMVRGLQPLLIALRVDGFLRVHWASAFFPSWALLFFGLGCAVLLLSFAPRVHSNSSSPPLRHTALALMYIVAVQLLIVSISALGFLVLLSQRLEYESSGHLDGKFVATSTIVCPLVTIFGSLIVVNPLLMSFSTKYQYYMYSNVLQRLDRPASGETLRRHEQRRVRISSEPQIQWFRQQISGNVYKRVEFSTIEASVCGRLPTDVQRHIREFESKQRLRAASRLQRPLTTASTTPTATTATSVRNTNAVGVEMQRMEVFSSARGNAATRSLFSAPTPAAARFIRAGAGTAEYQPLNSTVATSSNSGETLEHSSGTALPMSSDSSLQTATATNTGAEIQQQQLYEVDGCKYTAETAALYGLQLDTLHPVSISINSRSNLSIESSSGSSSTNMDQLTDTITTPSTSTSISTSSCVVCLSRPVNCIFVECGHAVTCVDCAVAVMRQGSNATSSALPAVAIAAEATAESHTSESLNLSAYNSDSPRVSNNSNISDSGRIINSRGNGINISSRVAGDAGGGDGDVESGTERGNCAAARCPVCRCCFWSAVEVSCSAIHLADDSIVLMSTRTYKRQQQQQPQNEQRALTRMALLNAAAIPNTFNRESVISSAAYNDAVLDILL